MRHSKYSPSTILQIRKKALTMTAQQLAFEFGVSKNAIIGLCHREKIPLTAFSKQHPWSMAKEKKKPVALRKAIVLHEGNIKNMDCKPLPPQHGEAGGVWASGGCLEVIGSSRGSNIMGCCRPTVGDGTYCADHERDNRPNSRVVRK